MDTSRGYEEYQLVTRHGHGIRMYVTYPKFGDRWPLDRNFTCLCKGVATSWTVRVTFPIDSSKDGVACEVVINRTDSHPISLDTDLWVILVPPSEMLEPICSGNMRARGMAPNVRARSVLARFVSKEVLKHLHKVNLQLRVFFLVHGCHVDERVTGVMEDYIPPTDEEEMVISEM